MNLDSVVLCEKRKKKKKKEKLLGKSSNTTTGFKQLVTLNHHLIMLYWPLGVDKL